jgi:hypothetical protein
MPQTKQQSKQWLVKGEPGPIKAKVHASRSKQMVLAFFDLKQCCGAKTICFCSGSNFQKVSGSGYGSGNSLGTTCSHRFYVKKYIFHVFNERKST